MTNWDALGAIGEIAGAIAVLVTLIYLAIQIKDNSELAKVQINQSGFEAFSRYRVLCVENAYVVSKTYRAEALMESEHTMAQAIVSEALFASATLYETSKVTDPPRVPQFIKVGASLIRRHHWKIGRNQVDPRQRWIRRIRFPYCGGTRGHR